MKCPRGICIALRLAANSTQIRRKSSEFRDSVFVMALISLCAGRLCLTKFFFVMQLGGARDICMLVSAQEAYKARIATVQRGRDIGLSPGSLPLTFADVMGIFIFFL